MLNKDKYIIESNIDKFYKLGYTGFLDSKQIRETNNILGKKGHIYEPFIDSDYKCLYKDNIPNITCFEIVSNEILTHSMIMGTLYNFNIKEYLIGDIIVTNKYYVIVLNEIKDYIKDNLNMIGKYRVSLKETDIPIYERSYEDLEYIVTSPRIDNVISKITNLNRKYVVDLIDNKDVILNYDILTNKSYNLKENDVFSIRRYGKYKYMGIIKNTKKDNIVINIKKYK